MSDTAGQTAALCYDGVRVLDAPAKPLLNGHGECAALWATAQAVVTQLRIVAEKA